MYEIEKKRLSDNHIEQYQEKHMSQVIEEFVFQYLNINTRKRYGKILGDYFASLKMNFLIELLEMMFSNFPLLVKQTSEFIQVGKISTIKLNCSAINSFYKWLAQVYRIKDNPVIRPKLPKENRKATTKSLDESTLKRKLRLLKNYSRLSYLDHLVYALASLLVTTSFRISEGLQVTVEMVEIGNLTVVQKRGEVREMELPPLIRRELLDFVRSYELKGFLFQTEGKRKPRKQLSRGQAYDLLKREMGISCHGFRKSAIEILLEQNEHPIEIAKVTGHSSIEMIMYYDGRDKKPSKQHKIVETLFERT